MIIIVIIIDDNYWNHAKIGFSSRCTSILSIGYLKIRTGLNI